MNTYLILYTLAILAGCAVVGALSGVFIGFFIKKISDFMLKIEASKRVKKEDFLIPMDVRDIENPEKWDKVINFKNEKKRLEGWSANYHGPKAKTH